MQKKSEKIIFTLYLLGFLALALTLALLQPLANTPPLYGNCLLYTSDAADE